MLSAIRSHLTYANVTATLALFAALGGVGYAAATLPRNSVGAAQIRKDAVTGAKVRNSSLTGADIRNRSLTASDFKGSVQGPQGIQGPKGDVGPQGVPGAPGADATRLWGVVDREGASPVLAAGRGVMSVTRLQTGWVMVRFDRDVRACSFQVTVQNDGGGPYSALIDAQVWVPSGYPPTDVVVVTRAASDGLGFDIEWSIAAFC